MKPQGLTGKKEASEPSDLINASLSSLPAGQRGRGADRKEVAAKRADIPKLSSCNWADRGSEPKEAASSEICLCYHGSEQTRTLEDEEAARIDVQEKAKAHSTYAAWL